MKTLLANGDTIRTPSGPGVIVDYIQPRRLPTRDGTRETGDLYVWSPQGSSARFSMNRVVVENWQEIYA